MTQEQAQQVLDELQGVRPEALNGEAKRLFEAIMKIADNRDELYEKVQEQNKIIDLMAERLAFDSEINCIEDVYITKEQIKQYLEKKAEEKK